MTGISGRHRCLFHPLNRLWPRRPRVNREILRDYTSSGLLTFPIDGYCSPCATILRVASERPDVEPLDSLCHCDLRHCTVVYVHLLPLVV